VFCLCVIWCVCVCFVGGCGRFVCVCVVRVVYGVCSVCVGCGMCVRDVLLWFNSGVCVVCLSVLWRLC